MNRKNQGDSTVSNKIKNGANMTRKIFYIADMHFGFERAIECDSRPFDSLDEMHSALISNWNSVVTDEDIVCILGDFCHWKEADWFPLLETLAGQKVFVRGNHDPQTMRRSLKKRFLEVTEYMQIKDNGRRVILSHYPLMFYRAAHHPNVYHLCGHVHNTRENMFLEKWRQELKETRSEPGHSYGNIINVGCMMPYMNYTPRTLDELLAGIEELSSANIRKTLPESLHSDDSANNNAGGGQCARNEYDH